MRLDDSPSGGVFAFSAGIAIKVVAASHDQVLNFGGEATVGDCARYWARDEISLAPASSAPGPVEPVRPRLR